jgi:RNA polymerase sigma-70 factor (ECF subfamily)
MAVISEGTSPAELWSRRAFEKQLMNVLPDLRAFARFLVKSPSEADDLVQDTLMRALKAYRSFDLNTNIKAWSFTIMRRLHINSFRKVTLEELPDDTMDSMSVPPNQQDSLELKEVIAALHTLARTHREVLALVRAGGVTYDDAAAIMGCKLGTIKSRVNRADAALRAALGPGYRDEQTSSRTTSRAPESPSDFGR